MEEAKWNVHTEISVGMDWQMTGVGPLMRPSTTGIRSLAEIRSRTTGANNDVPGFQGPGTKAKRQLAHQTRVRIHA